jgi:hypothetical protein
MPIRLASRRMDAVERRFDGPIPPPDPAAPPSGPARARLFQRLAAEQREDISRRRLALTSAVLAGDRALRLDQERLRFYRDQGTAWMTPWPKQLTSPHDVGAAIDVQRGAGHRLGQIADQVGGE